MAFSLRPYQQVCVDKALAFLKASVEPCIIDAAPAAGKSFMIAAMSDELYRLSGGKRILNLAPSRELVIQNHQKMLMAGHPASIFSASAGQKSTRHNIVFGTPGTVKRSISRFLHGYCAVNVDEAHGITPTIKGIIEAMRAENPNLRVIGWSGTPFRLGTGYVYRLKPDGSTVHEGQTKEPYFYKLIHRVSAREMLDQGFICPMEVGEINSETYDAGALRPNPRGKFDSQELHAVFEGHGRKTADIVADVVERSKDRFGGCMLFAATVQHAREIMASLPPINSGVVTGDYCAAMGRENVTRQAIVKAYRDQRFKYLVSVGALTTGFDVEHTSTIATLRKTESAALLQQILGRAWRLHPEKTNSVWLDYTNQCEEHFPDGDIYEPNISVAATGEGKVIITAKCERCEVENEFTARGDIIEAGAQWDENGYVVDLENNRIMTEHGPMPAHYGRRCWGHSMTPEGVAERCGYRWTYKECPECEEANDIAARYCHSCRAEIVDPNEKLVADFKRKKRDPGQLQTDEVLSMSCSHNISTRGNKTLRVDYSTPYRSFSVWLQPEGRNTKAVKTYREFMGVTQGGKTKPETITYQKNKETGFYRVLGYNKEKDALNEA